MPAIIDSAPACITNVSGASPADDSADFIVQAAYEKCAGFMTFGPGSTFGDDGAGAATGYYVLTWVGIAVMVIAIVAWVLTEDRRLRGHAIRIGSRDRRSGTSPEPHPGGGV